MYMPDIHNFEFLVGRHKFAEVVNDFAGEIICTDRNCRWFSETSEHYVHDHKQMDEIAAQEEGMQ